MGYRILMLDDQKEHAASLRKTIGRSCDEVLEVTSVGKAMQWLNSVDHVDVIVANAFLEKENVFQFLTAVKKDPRHNWIQFIVLCSEPGRLAQFLTNTTEKTARMLGADKYLIMPQFSAYRLISEIEASLPNIAPQKEEDPEGEALGVPRQAAQMPIDVNEAQRSTPRRKTG